MSNLKSRIRLTNRENNVGGLPRPAVSSPTSHPSQRRSRLPTNRWKFFLHYIKNGTGYGTKQPEWSSSMLDVSDHEKSTGSDPDAELDADDLGWISGQNGEEVLSLILVERELSNASQASPGPTTSQENLNPAQDTSNTNKIKISNDHTYRLKGYERSIHEPQAGALTPFVWVRYRAIPWIRRAFLRYCYPEFNDAHVERIYSDRVYDSQKFLAFVCSTWLVISWAIALTLLPKHNQISDVIFFYCVAPVLTVPLPLMIFYDLPKRFPTIYQCFLLVSIWSWSAYSIIFMQLCDYYGGQRAYLNCAGRDMLNLFYYMIALPVIALYGMGQHRIYATIAALVMIITPTALFAPRHSSWVRFAIEHLFLQTLLLYIHWRREILERNVYFFNKKVKDTLVALHHTRMIQARIEAARARSTGYIFHEVRQPLNAAFLAYQNIVASTTIRPDQRFEWDTLRIKLASMSKLLNDVLDQKRMDAGKFEIVSRPYEFHTVVRQALASTRVEAERRNQEIITDLDQDIDHMARIGMYHAQHKSEEEIIQSMTALPAEIGIVMGDETRVTQVLTNLMSNSSKFTPAHGKIRINTRLISPLNLPTTSVSLHRATSQPFLTPGEPQTMVTSPGLVLTGSKWEETGDRLIVRIEVIDNGVGISPIDVKERRLFSPYAQAGLGRLQGGSGSGLGLSLVRRIVKLMGGRMGVDSLAGTGTTFWVELPLRYASSTPVPDAALPPPLVSSPMESYGSTGTEPSVLVSPVSAPSNADVSTVANRSDTNVSNRSREASKSLQSSFGRGLSVLIVDDDAVMRGLLQRLLVRLGCSVEGAENGRVALDKLGVDERTDEDPLNESSPLTQPNKSSEPRRLPSMGRSYDVIFLDNQMPLVSGMEMVATLRSAGRHDFVVGLTGDASATDQDRFRQAGADEVLPKPVLESSVKTVLQKAKERQASTDAPMIRVHQPP